MSRGSTFALLASVTLLALALWIAARGFAGDEEEPGVTPPSAQAADGVLDDRINDIYARARDSVVYVQARVAGFRALSLRT